jgi:hypothetical protein
MFSDKVLELPGGPIITSGVSDNEQTRVMNMFSLRPSVSAIPGGTFVSLLQICLRLEQECWIIHDR